MSYTITKTDGSTLTTLLDGTTNTTSTSLTLVGKNFPGYGVFLNQNFVKLLENFSKTTSPENPIQGQLWWDVSNKLLKVYQGTIWKVISSAMASSGSPSQPVVGDLWWDTVNSQLKVYSGTTWVTIGPAFTATSGQSGAVADIIADSSAIPRTVVKIYVSNTLVGIISKDGGEAGFSPLVANTAPGFTTIKAGFNLSTEITGLKYWGNAEKSEKLGEFYANAYARLNTTNSFTSAQAITNNNGLTIGASNDLQLSATTGSTNITSTVNGNDLNFYVKVNNVNTKVLSLSGTNGNIILSADPTTGLGVATKQYVDAANLYALNYTISSNSSMKSYADAIDTASNVAMKSYVDAQITATTSGASSTALRRDGANSITGNIAPLVNNVYNFGSSVNKFANVHATNFFGNVVGTSSQALYADLAERFEADTTYAPGTVVELGGSKEITKVGDELSENVFGVISTNAAYLMNAGAGSDETHPPVAVSGRVPVTVVGTVKKGDRLVSAGNGLARAANKSEMTPWNVIGRALTNKTSSGVGQVEAIVKLNS
jgi:hypothetical protein